MLVSTASTPLAGLVVLGLVAVLGPTTGAGAAAAPEPAPATPIKVIQNYSEDVVQGLGIVCEDGDVHAETHLYRRFDLSGMHDAAKGFEVSQVVLGVEAATSSDGSIPGHVLVWAIDKADPLLVANLEPVAGVAVNYDTVDDLTLMTIAISALVPAGKDMVLEAAVDASSGGDSFRPGANDAAETGDDDYIRASGCGAVEPVRLGMFEPMSNHVLYARGKAIECLESEVAVKTAAAAAATASKKARKAKTKLRKAKKHLVRAEDSGDAAALAKAQKKVKKAKQAKKKTKQAAKAADAALAAASKVADAECAQPELPVLMRPARRASGA